jgi:hypothetical protein
VRCIVRLQVRLHGKNIDTLTAENLVLPLGKTDYIGPYPPRPNQRGAIGSDSISSPEHHCRAGPCGLGRVQLPSRRQSARWEKLLVLISQSTGTRRVGPGADELCSAPRPAVASLHPS